MNEKEKGIYQKYAVTRNDGREISHGCFVLELKDPKARKAILTYATELEKSEESPELVYDLRSWVGKYDKVEKPKDVMTFYRAVLIAANKDFNEDTLYSVPPEDAEEYRMPGDLVLPAILTVDTRSYNEARVVLEEQKKAAVEAMDPLMQMTMNLAENSFMNSEYTDFSRYWSDPSNEFRETLKDKYEEVGKAVAMRLENKTDGLV